MNYLIARAIELAAMIHQHQSDKNGEPYIFHPLRVMNKVKHITHDVWIIAILHDTIEDFHPMGYPKFPTLNSYKAHIEKTFGIKILNSLEAISRKPDESYNKYIKRCMNNDIARTVKMYDLLDNLDPDRWHESINYKMYSKALGKLLNE